MDDTRVSIRTTDHAGHAGCLNKGQVGWSLLSPKLNVRLGCWNVRSLGRPTKQNSRLREVLRSMDEKRIKVLALSEVRWPGHGVAEFHSYVVIYSGVDKSEVNCRRSGVAIVLADTAVLAWKAAGSKFVPVSDRLLVVRLKCTVGFVSIVAVYAPTNEHEEESDSFYVALQECVKAVAPRDMIIIMGDFNARVGVDVSAWGGVIGRHGVSEVNENGLKLLSFCSANELVVTNTFFKHRDCHKFTWFHPGDTSGVGHVMDFILVNRKFRNSVLDSRVFRGTYLQSDHRLVVAKLRVKFKVMGKKKESIKSRYITNSSLLSKEQWEAYEKSVKEALVVSGDVAMVEQCWAALKEALISAQCVLPVQAARKSGDWVTEEVCGVSESKRKAWIRWLDDPLNTSCKMEYMRLRVLSKCKVVEAKEKWWSEQVQLIEDNYEESLRKGSGGSILKNLKKLRSSQCLHSSMVILDKNGAKLLTTQEQLLRWKEHFEGVLNVSHQVNHAVLELVPVIAGADLDGLAEIPSVEEVRCALKCMKNGKAPGEDGISVELLKLGGDTVVEWLTRLGGLIWEEEVVPKDWVKQVIVPIHKKGSKLVCDNYRGISLLSVPGKVLCKVLQRRLTDKVDVYLRESQCGFRKGRSCIDYVFVVRLLVEKAREFHRPVFFCFLDLKKAYDSVNREVLWEILKKRYCFPDKFVAILKAFHEGTIGVVQVNGLLSDEFRIENGVRQGDVLSPVLFNLFLDALLSVVESQVQGCGVTLIYNLEEFKLVGSRRKMPMEVVLADLEYADDMVVMCDSMEELKQFVRAVDSTLHEMGLVISAKKSCCMGVCPDVSSGRKAEEVYLDNGEVIAVTDEFQYLGSVIENGGGLEAELNARIGKAAKVFHSLKRVLWDRKEIGEKTKVSLFSAVVVSSLLYGCESWAITAQQTQRLQTFIMGCLRVILGISKMDKVRNVEVRNRAGMERVEVLMLKRRLKWLGHVVRMDRKRIPRCLLVSKMAGGKRAIGKPKLRWCDVVSNDLRRCDLVENWNELALDRRIWRGLIHACAEEINEDLEELECSRKDERKQGSSVEINNQEVDAPSWRCSVSGCGFRARSKAGLSNHNRQKHSDSYQQVIKCVYCGQSFKKQGHHNHLRFCAKK